MKLYLTLMALCLSQTALSQRSYVFNYDVAKKKIISFQVDSGEAQAISDKELKAKTFNKGDLIKVKIDDINTYAYKISISIDNQVFNNEPPKLLASLFTDIDPTALAAGTADKGGNKNGGKPVSFKYSKSLSNDISKVVQSRRSFFFSEVALKYRYLNSASKDELLKVKSYTADNWISDFNDAIGYVNQVQTKYLEYKGEADLGEDDGKVLDALYDQFKGKDYQNVFETYLKDLINVNANDFKYESPEVKVNGDKVNVTINITPLVTDDKYKEATVAQADSRKYSFLTKGFGHFSFSSGFFSSPLISKTYISKPSTAKNNGLGVPADTITGYRNVLDNSPDRVYGANALLHYTYKVTPGFEAGAHFGLGIPLNSKTNINYLFGLSILFFNDNRLGLNVGAAAGYVQEVSPNTDLTTFYRKSGDLPISYINKFVVRGLQFSVTYNLSDLFAKPAAAEPAK